MSKDWILPTVIDPAETVCVTIEVPKDDAHIRAFFGALEELGRYYNWEWDGLKSGLAVSLVWQRQIDIASEQVRTGVNCMLDCDEVEDCLETSTIINIIEGDVIDNSVDIVNNTTNVTINSTNITEIINNPPDGNVYADEPIILTNPACGAAFYVVAQVRNFIVDAENWTTAYTDETDTLENIAGVLSFMWSPLYALLAYLFDPSPPASVLTDYDAQVDDMRGRLYCDGFDKSEFVIFVRTLTNGDAIADFIDCIALSQWAAWYSIGQSDLSQDCSSFSCGWCYEFSIAKGNLGDWTGYNHSDGNGVRGILDATGWKRGANSAVKHIVQIYINFAATYISTVDVYNTTVPTDFHQLSLPDVTGSDYHEAPTGGTVANYSVELSSTGMWISHDMIVTETSTNRINKIVVTGAGVNPFGANNC